MLKLLIAAAIVFALLVIAEYLWRIKHIYSEVTRKFVHITVGTFVAFWPWFLSWRQIQWFAVFFLVAILLARSVTALSRIFTIFHSVYLIGRKTVGEVFFALTIGLTASFFHNRYIFMAALLHLSIADGLAAIIGTWYGKSTRYSVFGQIKSMVGSITFLVCSIGILIAYFTLSHASGFLPTILWLPLAATVLENVGIRGSDNLIVPMLVAVVLNIV